MKQNDEGIKLEQHDYKHDKKAKRNVMTFLTRGMCTPRTDFAPFKISALALLYPKRNLFFTIN